MKKAFTHSNRRNRALGGQIQPPVRRAADAAPEPEAPMAADVEASNLDRTEPDPRLTQTLDPEDSAQRLKEISKLNAAGDDLESVLDALESDPDPAVRVAAADLLAESQRREATMDCCARSRIRAKRS
jgi:hypothetical protein